MKILLVILICILGIGGASSQTLSRTDSISILFKAKLLTVSEFGFGNKKMILNDIENQKARFLKTKYSSFVFIVVEFSQPHRLMDLSSITFIRDCSYYLAFDISDTRYYKLGGFDTIDIDAFFENLKFSEGSIFKNIYGKEVEEIDIYCLYDYYMLNERKRRKRGFNCFDNCSENTQRFIITR